MQVEQPLCLDCAAKVKEEVSASLAATEAECAAYTAALAELKAQDARPLPPKARQPTLHPSDISSLTLCLTCLCQALQALSAKIASATYSGQEHRISIPHMLVCLQ